VKLGKKEHVPDARDLKFEKYRTTKLPKHPTQFGHEKAVNVPWGALGNLDYGDCVWAGADHEHLLWNAEAGKSVQFTDQTALADYSAVTGFNPNDPNSDQGTYTRDALNYRRKTGIVDAAGKRHKIGAYVALNPQDLTQLAEALFVFGCLSLGIQFPQSAFDQFDQHHAWAPVAGSPIEGGHYVPIVARRYYFEVVTWGRVQAVTGAFIREFADEAFACISEDALKNGKSPEGFDLSQLQADLNAL
jgi:hypothetical protein